MIILRYEGRPAALVFAGHIELYPRIAALEPDHPVRRWVFSLAFFGLRVINGGLPGPYSDRRAAHFARCALLPDQEFLAIASCDDAELAEHFNVPLLQIAERRLDLEVTGRLGIGLS